MKYEIRNLRSEDIFPMSKILSKVGFGQLKDCFDGVDVKNTTNVEAVGISVVMNFAGVLVSNLPKCETELYDFLSSLTGEKVNDLRSASLAEFTELIIAIAKKDDFKDFFGVVSKLFKSEE